MRRRLIVFITFLGGIYFFLEFVLPEKLPTPPHRDFIGIIAQTGGAAERGGWYQFNDLRSAARAAAIFGARMEVPLQVAEKPARLRRTDYEITIEIDDGDVANSEEMGDWEFVKGKWRLVRETTPMTFDRLAMAFGAQRDARGGFKLEKADALTKIAAELGTSLDIPSSFRGRPATIDHFKDGKAFVKTGLTAKISAAATDKPSDFEEWRLEKPQWEMPFSFPNGFSDLSQIAQSNGGVLNEERGVFSFDEAKAVLPVLAAFGHIPNLPDEMRSRPATLQRIGKNKLLLSISSEPSDSDAVMKGWLRAENYWRQEFLQYPPPMLFASRAQAAGAVVIAKDHYAFPTAETASRVAKEFGVLIDVPSTFMNRPATLTRSEGAITMRIAGEFTDATDAENGWQLIPSHWTWTYVIYRYFVFGAYHEEISTAFIVIGVMAIGLGLINILRSHGVNMLLRRKGWIHSSALVGAMLITIIVGFWEWSNQLNKADAMGVASFSKNIGHIYNDVILGLGGLLPGLSSAMFSLLAMYVAAAAYRAFRVKSGEAALMMLTALLVMLGQIPMGVALLDPIFRNWFGVAGGVASVRNWIMEYINTPAFRAIEFGAGIAGLAMAIRMWFSLESGSFFRSKE